MYSDYYKSIPIILINSCICQYKAIINFSKILINHLQQNTILYMINYSNFEIIMIILTFVIYSIIHVFSIFTIHHQTIIYENYLAF